jgi:hypothetical protein
MILSWQGYSDRGSVCGQERSDAYRDRHRKRPAPYLQPAFHPANKGRGVAIRKIYTRTSK